MSLEILLIVVKFMFTPISCQNRINRKLNESKTFVKNLCENDNQKTHNLTFKLNERTEYNLQTGVPTLSTFIFVRQTYETL